MDPNTFVGLGEINAIILRTIAIKLFPFALDHTKSLGIELVEVFG